MAKVKISLNIKSETNDKFLRAFDDREKIACKYPIDFSNLDNKSAFGDKLIELGLRMVGR